MKSYEIIICTIFGMQYAGLRLALRITDVGVLVPADWGMNLRQDWARAFPGKNGVSLGEALVFATTSNCAPYFAEAIIAAGYRLIK